MTRNLDISEPAACAGDRRRSRQYLTEFVPAMVLYAVLLVAALAVGNESTFGKVLLVLVPVVPFALVTRAVVRHLRRCDEFQRLGTLEAMAIGFAAAMLASLVVAFLGVARVQINEADAGWIPFVAGMTTWAVARMRWARR